MLGDDAGQRISGVLFGGGPGGGSAPQLAAGFFSEFAAGKALDDLPEPWEKEYLERARAGQIYGGNAVSFLNSF